MKGAIRTTVRRTRVCKECGITHQHGENCIQALKRNNGEIAFQFAQEIDRLTENYEKLEERCTKAENFLAQLENDK